MVALEIFFFVGLALGGWGVLEDVGGVDVRVSQ